LPDRHRNGRFSRKTNGDGADERGRPASQDGDKTKLSLTLDAFNILNTVNPRGFVGNMSSPLFSQASSAGSARRLQAGLRWSF
jgi:hypothetical protein